MPFYKVKGAKQQNFIMQYFSLHQFYTGLKYSISLDNMLPAKSQLSRRMATLKSIYYGKLPVAMVTGKKDARIEIVIDFSLKQRPL